MHRHLYPWRVANVAVILVAATSLLGACTGLLAPKQITISAERLQAGIAGHFPISRSIGEGSAFTVAVPRIALLPETNRVAVEADVSGGEGLLKRPFAGTVGLSQRLIFDAAENAVLAIDVHVDRLHIEGLDPVLERLAERLLRPLAERALERSVLYTLKPGDIERMRAAGVVPGEIRVEAAAIVIALVPAPP